VFKEIIVSREEIILLRERVCVCVCGQLSIRSILVLLFSFEVPLKKIIKKKLQQKETKKATTKKGLCVCFIFLCAVVFCDYLCVQSHVSSTV
jgi:hypothetical protein